MNTKIVLGVIAAIIIIFGLWIMGSYNGFVSMNQSVDTAWADVETQYQRRFDLIPNLVNATKGFLKQEQKVFGDIAEARTHYAGAQTPSDKIQASDNLNSALSRLLVIIENYPNLKSNETVKGLMDELAGTENRINVSRIRYNDITKTYNIATKQFPGNIIAGLFNFSEKPLFKSEEKAKTAPTVDLIN